MEENKMLAEFTVKNYKNFRDKLRFSLETSENYTFNQEAIQNGIIKDSVVVGYNASGKTNLGLAIIDIIVHLTDKITKTERSNLFYSNLYNQDDIVSFTYKFKFDVSILEYSYEKKDMKRIIRESVKIDGKEVIFSDKNSCFVHLKGSENLNLDNWQNSISIVKYIYANTILDKENKDCQIFRKFMKFVNQMLWFSSTERFVALGTNNSCGNMFEDICNLEQGVENLEKFLHEAHLSFELLEKDTGEGKTIYCKIGDREVAFAPLMSSGTRALVFLYLWYMQREDYSFIFIDEFDAFYHTDLSIAIIRKLMSEKNIQVVFTSHNTDVISNELLRPDCYFILENNTIQPLCNLTDKALREAHNIQKMYRAGAFYEQ